MQQRRIAALAASLVTVAVIAVGCVPPTPTPVEWKVGPKSVTVHDDEDNDAGDEPYIIQIGFRSKLGVAGSSKVTLASQCYAQRLPAPDAAPKGTTLDIPAGSADIRFPDTQNLDLVDLAAGTAPFEVIGTLSFVMERDGIFEGCAVSDALQSALVGTLRDALDLLIANSPTPPDTDALINLVVGNIGNFISAAGSMIGAVIEGLGNPDDVLGVAAQIHLPTTGGLTDLVNTAFAIGGIFAPGLEQGFIPLDGLPSGLLIRVGTLSNSTTSFRFTTDVADYTYRSEVASVAPAA